MDQEIQPTPADAPPAEPAAGAAPTPELFAHSAEAPKRRLRRVFLGDQGLRSGWLALVNLLLVLLFGWVLYGIAAAIHPFKIGDKSPLAIAIEVLILYLAIFGANEIIGLVRSRGLRWVFLGSGGLRAGWSVAIFIPLMIVFGLLVGTVFSKTHLTGGQGDFSPKSALFGELAGFLAMLGAVAIVALIEHRRIVDYNLTGPSRTLYFFSGLAAGFAALSALVGCLAWGGWLHFGPIALSGADIFKFGAIWAVAFLLVGCVEEGIMRCYLLFTLTRGINFWWALGLIGAMCLRLLLNAKGNGVWGVYIIALLGLVPCLLLHLKKAPSAGFWQAAWVTSTFFGFGHTGNNGENWIGIFAAAFIGFVFCVSVRVTGSAWWAIGCHAAWDWGETYFYGTADSGFVAKGHLLTSIPAGNALWSGGTDGPEGSILVIGIVLLLLIAILALYGRRKPAALPAAALEQAAG